MPGQDQEERSTLSEGQGPDKSWDLETGLQGGQDS